MPYVPRDTRTLIQSMAARLIARTELTDLSEGSVLLHMIATVAEEMQLTELRLAQIRDSFLLESTSGALLDERASELPPNGMQRRGATFAQGAVVTLTRLDEASEAQIAAGENYPDPLTVPAGSIFTRTDDPSVLYRTTEDVTFAGSAGAGLPGEGTISNVYVRAQTQGEAGNCASSTITVVVSAPSQIIGVTNSTLSNGTPAETDEQLRQRMRTYLASLARCQPTALEHAALSFVSTTGARALYASLYESPTIRGYSELVVDDGSGLSGNVALGDTVSGTVPTHGQVVLYHQSPATEPIAEIQVVRGATTLLFQHAAHDYVSIPERGLVYFPEGTLQADDVWTIDGYEVYTGLVSELQQYVEGDTSRPVDQPGWRAAGTRVRVRPAQTALLAFDVHVIPQSYVALSEVADEVRDASVAFIRGLAPGETFYTSQLIDVLLNNAKLVSVRIYEPSSSTFLEDQPTTAYDIAWRTDPSSITIIPAQEG